MDKHNKPYRKKQILHEWVQRYHVQAEHTTPTAGKGACHYEIITR